MATTRKQVTTLTIRLPESLKEQLAFLARATGRPQTHLVVGAVRQYLAIQAWQIAEIQAAIQLADAGEFATDERVAAVRAKFAGARRK